MGSTSRLTNKVGTFAVKKGQPDGIMLPMLPCYQEDGYDPDETKLLVIEYPGKKKACEKQEETRSRAPVRSPEHDSECGRVMDLGHDRLIFHAKPTSRSDHSRKERPRRFPTTKRTGKLGGFPRRLPL